MRGPGRESKVSVVQTGGRGRKKARAAHDGRRPRTGRAGPAAKTAIL